MEVQIHIFLTSAVAGGEWSGLNLEKNSQYPSDMTLCGPHSRSGRRGEGKILDPTGNQTPTPRSSSQ
jgi:hypothetical protein